ncbi:helix-turn-helix domain-containing protein [Variovorax paradoxus]|uniref:helix-turn-helix domain-containing protein n=1 Tax=Variovorax paradoxus TaxID=34073 RepID=UPI0027853413|nr:helix-turn-helix domain-containing protein [Variovorax paradoxus]MDQ0586455.1 transcriptional regulator with XRE-family HTH domain [Variovorax paradoxus]
MPSAAPLLVPAADRRLTAFGRRIHARRKALKVSATTAAEAAGVSRMTLHRIERGEPSVTMGAYMNALAALGLDVDVVPSTQFAPPAPVSGGVRIADYAQLRRLAWQLAPSTELTPEEAWATYERNWRHVAASALDARERHLLDELARTLGRKPLHV